MLTKQVINCTFSNWFPLFSHITTQSEIVKLSEDFIEYLLSDGIILPKSCEVDVSDGSGDQLDSEWDEENNESEDESNQSDIEFPELELRIKEILRNFGSVFPKLNWSSCEDSKWMSASGTQCRQPEDIYLLLKSSDRIVHDLTQPFNHCSDINHQNQVEYELVLKKWIDINPSMEFRCFVKNNSLIGITQRDVRSYYYHIQQQKKEIIEDIKQFFSTHLKNKFFDTDFVIDVYRPNRGRVVLIDINPFGETTDSLLFDWDQLNALQTSDDTNEESMPDFRCLSDQNGVQPQTNSMNSLPIEVNYGYNINDLVNGFHIDR